MLGNDWVLLSLPRCGLVVVLLFVGGNELRVLVDVYHVESELLVAIVTSWTTMTHDGLHHWVGMDI